MLLILLLLLWLLWCWGCTKQPKIENVKIEALQFYFQNPIMFPIILHLPYSIEYCRNMSGLFPIFHCTLNIVATFLSNIAKYFIATLQFQHSEIFLRTK